MKKKIGIKIGLFLAICFTLLSFNVAQAQDAAVSQSYLTRGIGAFDDFVDDVTPQFYLDDEKKYKLKVGGEARYRFEYRDDFNFNNASFEDDDIHMLRTRLDLKFESPLVDLFVQGQDAESFAGRQAHKTGTLFTNRLDLHQLWAQFKSPWEEAPLQVKVGRQKLAYGDQRFVGGFEWANAARVFDAVKVILTPSEKFKVDAWFSQVVKVDISQPDTADHDDNFYGLYTEYKPIKDHVIDTFAFYRHSRNENIASERAGVMGPLREYTLGNRFKGKHKSGFDYGTEWAWQFGSKAHDTIQAWALHAEIGYTLEKIEWKPRLSFEYNHGSGDEDATDGRVKTFDNLFPTNHIHYGYMDFQNLSNTNNFKLGFDLKPASNLNLIANYHWFFLDQSSGAWTNAGGVVNRRGASNASETVGQEIDLLAKWKAGRHLDFMLGYSHFFAGAFIKDTGPADDANFLYVETAFNF